MNSSLAGLLSKILFSTIISLSMTSSLLCMFGQNDTTLWGSEKDKKAARKLLDEQSYQSFQVLFNKLIYVNTNKETNSQARTFLKESADEGHIVAMYELVRSFKKDGGNKEDCVQALTFMLASILLTKVDSDCLLLVDRKPGYALQGLLQLYNHKLMSNMDALENQHGDAITYSTILGAAENLASEINISNSKINISNKVSFAWAEHAVSQSWPFPSWMNFVDVHIKTKVRCKEYMDGDFKNSYNAYRKLSLKSAVATLKTVSYWSEFFEITPDLFKAPTTADLEKELTKQQLSNEQEPVTEMSNLTLGSDHQQECFQEVEATYEEIYIDLNPKEIQENKGGEILINAKPVVESADKDAHNKN